MQPDRPERSVPRETPGQPALPDQPVPPERLEAKDLPELPDPLEQLDYRVALERLERRAVRVSRVLPATVE